MAASLAPFELDAMESDEWRRDALDDEGDDTDDTDDAVDATLSNKPMVNCFNLSNGTA